MDYLMFMPEGWVHAGSKEDAIEIAKCLCDLHFKKRGFKIVIKKITATIYYWSRRDNPPIKKYRCVVRYAVISTPYLRIACTNPYTK